VNLPGWPAPRLFERQGLKEPWPSPRWTGSDPKGIRKVVSAFLRDIIFEITVDIQTSLIHLIHTFILLKHANLYCYLLLFMVLANIRIIRTTIMVKHPLNPVIRAVSLGICPLKPVDHADPFLGSCFPRSKVPNTDRHQSSANRFSPFISLDYIAKYHIQA
jgi:hypothetical protein